MLPARFRLNRPQEVTAVLRRGRVVQTPFIRLHVVDRPDAAGSRVACVVGKNVSPSAVTRHRYQRLMRAVAAQTLSILPMSHDMVWVAKPTLTHLKRQAELQDSVAPYLKRLVSSKKYD